MTRGLSEGFYPPRHTCVKLGMWANRISRHGISIGGWGEGHIRMDEIRTGIKVFNSNSEC